MELVDLFLQDSKDKFLNKIIKIPKGYDWYMGLVVQDDYIDYENLEQQCNEICVKAEKHLQLLKIVLIDSYTLILFATDPIPFNNNIRGIIKSICKYLNCKMYEINYIKYFRQMIFDAWGEQQYHYLITDVEKGKGIAYDLTAEKEG